MLVWWLIYWCKSKLTDGKYMKKSNKCLTMLILAFGIDSTAQATDWTPVFSQWQRDCLTPHKVQTAIEKSATAGRFVTTSVAKSAKNGVYRHLPRAYRRDLLPAYRESMVYDGTIKDRHGFVVIPLKNATFANVKIKSFAFYNNNLIRHYRLNFGKIDEPAKQRIYHAFAQDTMTNQSIDADVASVQTNQSGELVVLCTVPLSG